MFAAHFGVAAAIKAKTPEVPLWALMIGTQLIDIIFVPLLLIKVETIISVSNTSYGGSVINAFYSHSLSGTIFLALLIGIGAGHLWGKSGGLAISGVIFSHWVLDLLVHRQDLPMLPGNFGNLPLLGLGLWKLPIASILIETIVISIGAFMYFRSITTKSNGGKQALNITAGSIMGLLLILSLVTDVVGV